MTGPISQATITILEDFRWCSRNAGMVEASRRTVVSRHDPTIRFTNSTISVLKPELVAEPTPRVFLLQPALRLRNLDHFAQTGTVSPYGCSFHAFGALLPAAELDDAYGLARELLVSMLGLRSELLLIRATDTDHDLIQAGQRCDWSVAAEPGTRGFRHVFGMLGTTGRNANIAIIVKNSIIDLGNVIIIERDGQPVAVELAFGSNLLVMYQLALRHPIQATVASDVLPAVTDLMTLDMLMTCAVMALDGMRPIARGRGGRYRQALQIVLERHGGKPPQVAADLGAIIELEAEVRTASSPLADGDTELTAADAAAAAADHVRYIASIQSGTPSI